MIAIIHHQLAWRVGSISLDLIHIPIATHEQAIGDVAPIASLRKQSGHCGRELPEKKDGVMYSTHLEHQMLCTKLLIYGIPPLCPSRISYPPTIFQVVVYVHPVA